MADSALDGTIDEEIRSGTLPITKEPTAGYRMPYRTAASMGLSTTEDGIHPYVMASGTYWAHVMIMQRPLRY